jgi:hypothetical protein
LGLPLFLEAVSFNLYTSHYIYAITFRVSLCFHVNCLTGSMKTVFYGPDNKSIGENYLRFGVCKSAEGLELATSRLRKLKSVLKEIQISDLNAMSASPSNVEVMAGHSNLSQIGPL